MTGASIANGLAGWFGPGGGGSGMAHPPSSNVVATMKECEVDMENPGLHPVKGEEHSPRVAVSRLVPVVQSEIQDVLPARPLVRCR